MAKIYLEEGDTTHARNLWQELISSAGRARPPITASCSATSRTAIMLPPWEMWTKAWPYPGKKHGRNSCTTRSLPANVRAISTPPRQKPRNMWKNTPRTSAAPGNTPSCRRGKLMGMNTIEELKERVILIGVSTSDGDDTEESLKELKELGGHGRSRDRRHRDPEPGGRPSGHLHRKRKNRGSPGHGLWP